VLAETVNLQACIQCGRCSGACPVAIKSNLNVRRLINYSLDKALKISELTELGVWECTACSACNERCPKDVKPANLITRLRSQLVEKGRIPTTIQAALESTYLHGNPWGRPREKRLEWAKDLNLNILAPGAKTDVLLFVCCTNCYDERCQKSARALVKLLRTAGVEFGVLGEAETCCCSEQRRMGEQGLFEEIAESNTKIFRSRNCRRIVTTSPHCFNVFLNDYPDLNLPVFHYTQLLAELFDQGRLKFTSQIKETITYHDPCFLGKQNKVFEEPRRLLKAVSRDFIEFERNRELSMCCEGGGGRMWIESESQGRLSEIRVRDAIDMHASVIATACPFCCLTLEDAVKTTNSEDKICIKDIAELLVAAL